MKYTAFFVLLSIIFAAYCTPKTGASASRTPVPPKQPATWDTLTKTAAVAADTLDPEGEEEYVFPDAIEVNADQMTAMSDSLPVYNPSHTFEHDLIHTRIDISFDWAKRRANGTAVLTLRPWFYPTSSLTLDAKNFDIQSVNLAGKPANTPLKYTYADKQKLVIDLGRQYTRKEEFKVEIRYTAKPEERESYGGSAAITSDKGLYFVNHDSSEMGKPRQIWTQGETESNSFWFPTVDKPNERCTQELYMTVDNKYKTLSNGILVSSKKNADGTRTDYWKMDKPHAPYLFMMAVGDFAVVKDKWRGIDVEYYVEPEFKDHARDIFPYTPEMLEFFSTKLDYLYPWSKYSQIVVRDYVSGAMENTTAVIFGEFMQKTKRELLDDHLTNEKVVAHEMFHHWFGDLVTTENWANLTLNEGFANYSEYLWLEHKYGRDEADYHLFGEQQGYLASAGDGGHPLIHFGYSDRETMFDAHSYNKGGCVLHMLRNYLGDEAFFAALSRYLKRNEYTDVEVHELRMAFEDVTGQDLNWFFNQWYLTAGHPVLDVNYGWDETSKKAFVYVEQKQTGKDATHIFNLPLKVDLYNADGTVRRENIRLTQRRDTFQFSTNTRPVVINFDAERALLSDKNDQHSIEEWANLYRRGPLFRDRWEALGGLENDDSQLSKTVYTEALSDKSWAIRIRALAHTDIKDPAQAAIIKRLAESDPEPSVRSSALALLGELEDRQYLPIFQKAIADDKLAYSVVSAALGSLQRLDSTEAVKIARNLENDKNETIGMIVADIYSRSTLREHLPFFEKRAATVDFAPAFSFFEAYQHYVIGLKDDALVDAALAGWKSVGLNGQTSQWRRFAATKAIADTRNYYKSKENTARAEAAEKALNEVREKETDPTLKLYYQMF